MLLLLSRAPSRFRGHAPGSSAGLRPEARSPAFHGSVLRPPRDPHDPRDGIPQRRPSQSCLIQSAIVVTTLGSTGTVGSTYVGASAIRSLLAAILNMCVSPAKITSVDFGSAAWSASASATVT